VSAGALPTFLVIGAAKCGTSSLHQYLGEHPEVQMSRTKELGFFQDRGNPGAYSAPHDPRLTALFLASRNWSRGLDWYRSQFDQAARVRGESSPGYTSAHYPGTAERIASVLPDARLIFCVRDPVERAISAYRWRRGLGDERRSAPEALVPGSYYVENSRYAARLAPYLDRFPRERILVVEAEQLDHNRLETLREVFAFLGVDEDFSSPAFERRWNVTGTQRGVRWRAISRLRTLPWWSSVATRVPGRAVWRVQRLTTARPAVEAEVVAPAALADSLREDAERFRAMVGLEFPGWSV
jgi:hypothetical protein